MVLKLILLILPTVILAGDPMVLEITGNYDPSVSDIVTHYYGSYSRRISEVEIQTWELTDDKLKDIGEERFGKRPDIANLRNTFFWKDLYDKNNVTEVTRHLRFKDVVVMLVEAEPTIILERVIYNNSTEPNTYKIDISHIIDNNITTKWAINGKLSIDRDIEYKLDIGLLNSGGTLSVSYASAWGTDVSMRQAVNVGKVSWVEVQLQPHQKVNAQVHTVKGLIRLEMNLEAYLTGNVVYQFEDETKGYSFEFVDIEDVITAAGLEQVKKSSEVIDIKFTGHTKIIIDNKADSNPKTPVLA